MQLDWELRSLQATVGMGTEAPLVCVLGAWVGSLVSLRSETPLPLPCGFSSLCLNPSVLVNSKLRGRFWPATAVTPLVGPLLLLCEAWLFDPCLSEGHSGKFIAAPCSDKAVNFPPFPFAASCICSTFNAREARVELRR